jgi:ABC-type glycerol-3-phosphate transport system substrate-binding protein
LQLKRVPGRRRQARNQAGNEEETQMTRRKITRRRFMATTAAASATMVAAPFVRTANAAGKISIGFWDHWVPGANSVTKALTEEWGAKEKVEVQIDYIPSQGRKNLITIAAEAQAKSGHDIFAFPTWEPQAHAEQLEPVDDVMADLIKEHGKVNGTVEYLGRMKGTWRVVPATVGSQIKGPCSRIDLMKSLAGIDVQAMYPAGSAPKAENWTLETFLKAAEACRKGGKGFGIGLGTTADSVDSVGAFFHAHGAMLVNEKGDITVKSDKVRQALEFMAKLAQFLPPDAPAWDDSSNNKWLVSGSGSLIMNPPSAWAVAKRDAPQVAEQCWTHGFPSGPNGRYAPFVPYFWGIWGFGKNKSAAKSLLRHLSTRSAAEKMVAASSGYDLPSFEKLDDFKTWAEEGPPKGTLYHYPNPNNHQVLSVAAAPAPPKIAHQIYVQGVQTKMVARMLKGEKMEPVLAWAENEVEGFMRT